MSEDRRPSTVTLGALLVAAGVAFLAGLLAGAAWGVQSESYRTVDECVLAHYAGGSALEVMELARRCEAVLNGE